MIGKKGNVILVIIFGVLVAVLVTLLFMLYTYLPGKSQNLNVTFPDEPVLETANLSYQVQQFYQNMKFNHNNIGYKIYPDCNEQQKARMKEAFSEIESKVEPLKFYEDEEEYDIEVICSKEVEDLVKEKIDEDFFIAGEGGAEGVIKTERYNVITKGVILLYDTPSKAITCEWPNVELHELLHVLGFKHSEDKESLMYPYLESCSQKLDESIINDLNELYSRENLADLYFTEVKAVKRGIYLDFNVTIKNSGVIDAENVVLSIVDKDEVVERFELNDIPFGGGVSYQVTNMKLSSKSSKEVELVIDRANLIAEIDENNNIATLVLG